MYAMETTIGKKLKELRQEKGLKLKDAAALAQRDITFLSKIENDRYIPTTALIETIADGYGLNDEERFELHFLSKHSPEFEVAISKITPEKAAAIMMRSSDKKHYE